MTKYTRENLLPASLLITTLSLPFSPILLAVPGLVPPSPFCLSSPSYHSSALPPYFQPLTQACLDLQHPGWVGGRDGVWGWKMQTITQREWINKNVLLFTTGNGMRCPGINQNAKDTRKNVYMDTPASLCSTAK